MTRTAISAITAISAPTAIASALALLLPAPAAHAQDGPRWVPPVGVPSAPAPRALNAGAYAGNASAARVVVEVARDGLPADGQSATAVTVRVFAANGQPLIGDAVITVETSGGRVLLPGARTDELGPNRGDADRTVKGTQIPLAGGVARFNLIAPDKPQEVALRVTAGAAQAEGTLTFLPDLRDTLAVGLVEGVVRLSRQQPNTIQPVRLDDGFEAEIRRFQRQFANGRGEAALRTAFFLKGKIKGDALLTAAYDSDKETRGRLLRDIKPESFYPVYGDSSVKTFDAQSSSKLYVRVDKHKSYLLYGDFATGDGFSQPTSGGMVAPQQLRSLGAYNRTLTGARGHWEQGRGVLNVFAANDTLKQVVEELRAFGTSGPFVLRNNSALENSEKVEIVIRRKDSPGTIKSVQALRRFDDYNFEPFSGRILLARPLPSIDSDGDLASLRITYEVDQGGERFWVAGADAQLNVTPGITLGGSLVQDKNALSPYKLGSMNAGAQLNATTRATVEVARSSGTVWDNGGAQSTNPTYAAGEQRLDQAGNAARVAVQHQGESTWLDASWIKTAREFFNPAAPLQQGRSEASVKGGFTLRSVWRFFAELLSSKDEASGGRRVGGVVGAELKVSDDLTVTGGVRKVEENAAWNSSGNLIAPNPTQAGGTGTGGLYGGIDPQVINPSTGQPTTRYALLPAAGTSQGIGIDATTVFLGARYKVNERLTLHALAEGSVQGDAKHRYLIGGSYQLSERSRLYANYEDQSGITSAYGAARSRALSIGAETNYMPGGDLFTEYRLRDATSREAQWANGVRNTWMLKEGVTATTGAEYVSVLNGQGGSAAAATVGLDYTANPLWKLGARLEWRRVFDNNRTAENDRSDSLLSTLTVARKLDRDWTLLVRNYLLANRYASSPIGSASSGTAGNNGLPPVALNGAGYNALQNRFQVGMAFRPVDTDALDMLAKYENKIGRNADGQIGLRENVHIASLHAVVHPSRPWWLTGRLAAKSRREEGLSADGATRYDAWMASGRLVYDITENWDLGLMAASLQGRNNGAGSWARQYAVGVEAGYQMQSNLWLSAGYNVRGFSDRDLSATEYTNRGAYLRLRFKFDEDLFRGNNRSVNRTLDREASAGAKP